MCFKSQLRLVAAFSANPIADSLQGNVCLWLAEIAMVLPGSLSSLYELGQPPAGELELDMGGGSGGLLVNVAFFFPCTLHPSISKCFLGH